MPIETDEILKKTLAGISKAERDYKKCSGGVDLWEAPEYMITTSIARKLSSLTSSAPSVCVTMEERACRVVKGWPENQERFDIVVWCKDKPVAITEVKNDPPAFANIAHDVERICNVLNLDNGIKVGSVAYYISSRQRNGMPPHECVDSRLEGLRHGANEIAIGSELHFTSLRSQTVTLHYESHGDFSWGSAVLGITQQ